MNHLRNLLETKPWQVLVNSGISDQEGTNFLNDFYKQAPDAMCFWLGDIDTTDKLKCIPELCGMPYDNCWFEFTLTYKLEPTLFALLAVKTEACIRTYGFRRKQHWELRYIADKENFAPGPAWVLPNCDAAANEASIFEAVIFKFLSAIRCTNTNKTEHKPSEKLQKARHKRGKKPLFSFWTLELKPEYLTGNSVGGTHASPRLHLRRGHPRQYAPDKWTWVQPCAVGRKELGMIHKDYKAAEARA